jgi:hypothetical protein
MLLTASDLCVFSNAETKGVHLSSSYFKENYRHNSYGNSCHYLAHHINAFLYVILLNPFHKLGRKIILLDLTGRKKEIHKRLGNEL